MRSFIIIVLLSFGLTGCMESPVYQKQFTIPNQAWKYDFRPEFEINIADTGIYYAIDFIVRHTEAYPYSNIWLFVNIKEPGDTVFTRRRIELPLAEGNGKWLGRQMGEIVESRIAMTNDKDASIFARKGTYLIQLEQNMRINPLPQVLNVGLRVQKGKRKEAINVAHTAVQ